jgi:hypothetical protein
MTTSWASSMRLLSAGRPKRPGQSHQGQQIESQARFEEKPKLNQQQIKTDEVGPVGAVDMTPADDGSDE